MSGKKSLGIFMLNLTNYKGLCSLATEILLFYKVSRVWRQVYIAIINIMYCWKMAQIGNPRLHDIATVISADSDTCLLWFIKLNIFLRRKIYVRNYLQCDVKQIFFTSHAHILRIYGFREVEMNLYALVHIVPVLHRDSIFCCCSAPVRKKEKRLFTITKDKT